MKNNNNKNYLKYEVNPLLKSLMMDLMTNQPEDIINYMVNWFSKDGLEFENKNKSKLLNLPEGIESDSEEDEYLEEEPIKKMMKAKVQRESISAEAYGKYNRLEDIKLVKIEKSVEQIERINLRMTQEFIFSNLDNKEKEVIVNSMAEKKFKKGDVIIKQGDKFAKELFIVESGTLDCYKKLGDENKFIKKYIPGESFGELALLYNAPRATTITALEDCVLFSLGRDAFNLIVKESAIKKREYFENFLKNYELFDSINNYERSRLSECLVIKEFKNGEVIITEGEIGNEFFLIMEGSCIAVKTNKDTGGKDIVYEFKENDYFGELSLINDEKRNATIISKSKLKLASIDRLSFRRLLGPLEDILKRNSNRYEKYIKTSY